MYIHTLIMMALMLNVAMINVEAIYMRLETRSVT